MFFDVRGQSSFRMRLHSEFNRKSYEMSFGLAGFRSVSHPALLQIASDPLFIDAQMKQSYNLIV